MKIKSKRERKRKKDKEKKGKKMRKKKGKPETIVSLTNESVRASNLYDKNQHKIDFLSPQGTGEQIRQSWNENQIKKGKKETRKIRKGRKKEKKEEKKGNKRRL